MTDPCDSPPPTGPRPFDAAGLVSRAAAAAFCGVGLSTWDKLTAAGRTPPPIRLGGKVLWRPRELRAWVDAGCPDRAAWVPQWTALRDARPPA